MRRKTRVIYFSASDSETAAFTHFFTRILFQPRGGGERDLCSPSNASWKWKFVSSVLRASRFEDNVDESFGPASASACAFALCALCASQSNSCVVCC